MEIQEPTDSEAEFLYETSKISENCHRMESPKPEAQKNMVGTFLGAAGNIVSNASSRLAKGEFLEIGKLITLPKQAPVVIRKVKNMIPKRKEAENIAPVQKTHTKESLICDKCGEFFKTTNNLKMHQLRHEGIKAFACTGCDQRFVNPYLLKLHERVRHLGETPYACQFCEKKFFTSATRTYHERTQHIRDRSYKCNFCSLVFNAKSDLNKHKYRHTDQKPFRCDVCNVSFSRRFTLNHHYSSQSHYKKANSVQDSQPWLILDDTN